MAAAHSATIYTTKRQLWIANVNKYIVDASAAGTGVFNNSFDVFTAFTKNIKRQRFALCINLINYFIQIFVGKNW